MFCIQRSCTQNKISPNNAILLKGILTPKLLNNPFAFCFLINLDLLLPQIAHLHNIIVLPVLVFETLGFMLPVFLLHFKQ